MASIQEFKYKLAHSSDDKEAIDDALKDFCEMVEKEEAIPSSLLKLVSSGVQKHLDGKKNTLWSRKNKLYDKSQKDEMLVGLILALNEYGIKNIDISVYLNISNGRVSQLLKETGEQVLYKRLYINLIKSSGYKGYEMLELLSQFAKPEKKDNF